MLIKKSEHLRSGIRLSYESILQQEAQNRQVGGRKYLTITPFGLKIYRKYDYVIEQRLLNQKSIENLSNKSYSGKMSVSTEKVLKERVQMWYEAIRQGSVEYRHDAKSARRRLVFLTLTLPFQQQDYDKDIKRKILNYFIILLKRQYGLEYYVWRAEAQKNGNIHFHMIIDIYIDKDELRYIWLKALCSLHYWKSEWLDDMARWPPCTDIQAVKSPQLVSAYLAKYICKNDGYRLIEGAIWGMSDPLRKLEYPTMQLNSKLTKAIERYADKHAPEYIITDFIEWVQFDQVIMKSRTNYEFQEIFRKYALDQFKYLYYSHEFYSYHLREEAELVQRFRESADTIQEVALLDLLESLWW